MTTGSNSDERSATVPEKGAIAQFPIIRLTPPGALRVPPITNAFSKKVENHAHAVALHMMFYNFGRVHKTLRVTPAMQAGIADHVWSLEEIAALAS